MGYYRVRKNWNNGKWDSSQICAYTDKQKAIQECTEERVQQGYKVFDPDGKVVYPITLEKQTKVLKNDGVIPDDEIEYWNDIFNRKKLYATKYVKKCCKLYFSVVEAGSLWYSISAKRH